MDPAGVRQLELVDSIVVRKIWAVQFCETSPRWSRGVGGLDDGTPADGTLTHFICPGGGVAIKHL